MKVSQHGPVTLYDYEPTTDDLGRAVLSGLRLSPKILPSKFFYDERGSALFDAICELEEYYPTRTEVQILTDHIDAISDCIGPAARLLEPGSGSTIKTRLLLGHLLEPAAYVPIDIARAQLIDSALSLAEAYPQIEILPVCADFMQEFAIPTPSRPPAHTAVFFPGSTIGNLMPAEAERFLRRMAGWGGPGSGLLIGVDLKKDRAILEAAYNDARGVTAEFNLNLLARINRDLGADLDLAAFHHRAFYNEREGRIEMHLVSTRPQTVHVLDQEIQFAAGESITTEYSYKYAIEQFQALAARAGFRARRVWTDPRQLFSVHYLVAG
jgi:dimethylhistidine N-methyltransferase